MIRLRVTLADLGQMRFAYSPLTEVAESLYMTACGRIQPVHREWFASVRRALSSVDMGLLLAVVPPGPVMADFLFAHALGPQTTIEQQLGHLAALPREQFEHDLRDVWAGRQMPGEIEALIRDGTAGASRVADSLAAYWAVAVKPHWSRIRAVLDDDVAFRAGQLTNSGMRSMLAELHPDVSIHGSTLNINKKHAQVEGPLNSAGLRLVPSVFVWPNVIFAPGVGCPAVLTYPARGVGNLWGTEDEWSDDVLGCLLGRSRAAILASLSAPYSTTELAVMLDQTPPAVSQHLAVLRRSGLVVSWRKGRSVLYQQTSLGASVVAAASASARDSTAGR